MSAFQYLLFLSAATVSEGWILKIGGPVQSTGYGAEVKKVFAALKDWAEDNAEFEVETHWMDYDAATAASIAADMTDPGCSDHCVDVLVCPYGSGGSKITIAGVPANSPVPILVWGGAADDIFTTTCQDRNCFGTLTVASKYFDAALTGLAAVSDEHLTVGLISNDNAFSTSLANGIRAIVEPIAEQVVPRGALDASGKAMVVSVMDAKPDVITITGHSGGDVEDIIMTIAQHTWHRPKAIVATNSLTSAAKARFEEAGMVEAMETVIMPQQWAKTAGLKDDVVHWTSSEFISEMGGSASYQAASAGAAAVALANALKGKASVEGLATAMRALDIHTFYGHVSFTANGNLAAKPMYADQQMKTMSKIVMPIEAASGYLRYPLSAQGMWAQTQTHACSAIKMVYKNGQCCGQPNKQVHFGPKAAHR